MPLDRLRARRSGACRARARVALPRPVAERPPAAHCLHRGHALLSRPRVLAGGALARRAADAADVGHRPAADSRDCGAARPPSRARRRARRRVRARAPAEAGGLARVHLPGACARRRRPRRGLAPVGDRHGQLAALGRAARADRAHGRRRARVPPSRHRVLRHVPAADERALRPVRVPGRPLPGARLPAGRAPRGVAVRRPGGDLQRAAGAGEPRPRRDRACCGRGSGPLRGVGRAHGGRDEREALGRRARRLRRPRRPRRRADRHPHRGRLHAALRGRSRRRPRGRDGRAARGGGRRSRSRRVGAREPSAGRPPLRADPLLARPDLARHELVPLPRPRPLWLSRPGQARSSRTRRAAAALRFLGALQPHERSRPRREGVLLDRRPGARRALRSVFNRAPEPGPDS